MVIVYLHETYQLLRNTAFLYHSPHAIKRNWVKGYYKIDENTNCDLVILHSVHLKPSECEELVGVAPFRSEGYLIWAYGDVPDRAETVLENHGDYLGRNTYERYSREVFEFSCALFFETGMMIEAFQSNRITYCSRIFLSSFRDAVQEATGSLCRFLVLLRTFLAVYFFQFIFCCQNFLFQIE